MERPASQDDPHSAPRSEVRVGHFFNSLLRGVRFCDKYSSRADTRSNSSRTAQQASYRVNIRVGAATKTNQRRTSRMSPVCG